MEGPPVTNRNKRPTARDINDLKARLGLKKSERSKRGSGIVPPPGAIAPPPGMQPNPNHLPPPPGASSSMPQVQQQAAPEVVVIREGEKVEEVGSGKNTGRLAKFGAFMLIPLAIGGIAGSVLAKRSVASEGEADKAAIKERIKSTQTSLKKIADTLVKSRNAGYAVDPAITKELKAAAKELPDSKEVKGIYSRNLAGTKTASLTLQYFERVKYARNLLSDHITNAKSLDPKAAEVKANKKAKKLGFMGVVVNYNDGKASADLVQLGRFKDAGQTSIDARTSLTGSVAPRDYFRPASKTDNPKFGMVIPISAPSEGSIIRELLQDKDFLIPVAKYQDRLKDLDQLLNGKIDDDGNQRSGLNELSGALLNDL